MAIQRGADESTLLGAERFTEKHPEAELITKVPTYAQKDHLTIEVPTRKQYLRTLPIPVPSK
jgi:hypothetical protein